jgi:hypothetical protein
MRELLTFEERRNLLLAAWCIAALATVLIEIPLLILFPLFPLGFYYRLRGTDDIYGFWPVTLAWTGYLLITFSALFTKRWLFFVLLYGILVAMLVLNVQGCHAMLKKVEWFAMRCSATASRTDRLRLGMTKEQVLAVMGQPASTAADRDVEVLRYKLSATGHDAFHHRTEEYFVRLVGGKVERFGKAGDWESHKGPTGISEQKWWRGQQIAAGNAGWRLQFRFAVHAIWFRVPELWTFAGHRCLTRSAN